MMSTAVARQPASFPYRCAGPNCGRIKDPADRWWLMWTSTHPRGGTVLSLCAWDEQIAVDEAALHICSDQCAAKLLSQFLANMHKALLAQISNSEEK